jgi:hypothetical protein
MTIHPRTYRFTVTSPEGQPLFTVLLTRERPEPATSTSAAALTDAAPAHPPGPAGGSDAEPRMTEPQKRYLFRLLAQQGIDATAVEGHLKEVFQVATLREVSKTAASQLIEELITTHKEGSHAHA